MRHTAPAALPFVVLAAVIVAGLPNAPAAAQRAQAEEASTLGELRPALFYGERGAWTARTNGESYALENEDDPRDLQYFWVPVQGDRVGSRTVGVTLDFNGGDGMFGLLYGYQDDPKRYFMVTIGADMTLRLTERTARGEFVELSSSTLDLTGPPRLEIVEDGQMLMVKVDGREVFGMGNDRMGRGAVGIVAAGVGRYVFEDFTITSE